MRLRYTQSPQVCLHALSAVIVHSLLPGLRPADGSPASGHRRLGRSGASSTGALAGCSLRRCRLGDLSLRYPGRLAKVRVRPRLQKGDSYDNGLSESIIGLFDTEVTRRRSP